MPNFNRREAPVSLPKDLGFDDLIQSVLKLSDAQKLAEVHAAIGEIPRPFYQSDSPLLIRGDNQQVIEVKDSDGQKTFWSVQNGYSDNAKADYLQAYEQVASKADDELRVLLEINGVSAPQFLAQTLEVYLDLLEHIVKNHEFSPGHDRKHLSRDITETIKVFQDSSENGICIHPSDLFCGAIGSNHNNSVGLVPRYEDFQHLATHADAGVVVV